MAKKFTTIGSINESKNGKKYLQLDNLNLKVLMDALTAHGKKYLAGLTADQIKARQNVRYDEEGHIPRIQLLVQQPSEKAPDFILSNITLMEDE